MIPSDHFVRFYKPVTFPEGYNKDNEIEFYS